MRSGERESEREQASQHWGYSCRGPIGRESWPKPLSSCCYMRLLPLPSRTFFFLTESVWAGFLSLTTKQVLIKTAISPTVSLSPAHLHPSELCLQLRPYFLFPHLPWVKAGLGGVLRQVEC